MNSNKHKRHPTHKKDFSDDEDDDDCQQIEKWSPPTKAARKMFDTNNDLEVVAPTITPDTISSMPKPPTISETIFRLHQNLNSSVEKSKEKKRKKKSTETGIPAHLEHHLYAKPTPCVSSCSQPNTNNSNYGYFAQFSANDSKLYSESNQSNKSLNFGQNNVHPSDCMSAPVQSTSHSTPHSTSHSTYDSKSFLIPLNEVKKEEKGLNGQQTIPAPPHIKPYYEYCSSNNLDPYSKPPLLKQELGQQTQQKAIQSNSYVIESNANNNFHINNRMNGMNELKQMDSRMVEASTSTEDLNSACIALKPSVNSNPPNVSNVSLRVFKLYKII